MISLIGGEAEQDADTNAGAVFKQICPAESLQTPDRLSSIDARLDLMELLHQEFLVMRESLGFSQQQVASLVVENKELQEWVQSLNWGMSQLSRDNKYLKETVLDLQSHSMKDNLFFSHGSLNRREKTWRQL